MEKVIPIGYEDIKGIIDRNLYYVDKSLMIKDLVDSAASVNLFTRPRRFGKTLNLSMIRRFFEAGPQSFDQSLRGWGLLGL